MDQFRNKKDDDSDDEKKNVNRKLKQKEEEEEEAEYVPPPPLKLPRGFRDFDSNNNVREMVSCEEIRRMMMSDDETMTVEHDPLEFREIPKKHKLEVGEELTGIPHKKAKIVDQSSSQVSENFEDVGCRPSTSEQRKDNNDDENGDSGTASTSTARHHLN